MRIIAGSARGRALLAPKGRNTRPTLDRVKESLFGILQFSIPGSRVLDLFAGSGNLGLEALSRGADFALFNDHDAKCCTIIRQNLEACGFPNKAMVLQLEAMQAISRIQAMGQRPFDFAFLDPPYRDGAQVAAQALFQRGLIAPGGMVIIEHSLQEPPHAVPGIMRLTDLRKYGDTGIAFFAEDSLQEAREEQ